MLSELNISFSLIGLSETKFKIDKSPLVNVDLLCYTLISEPSLSNADGVAFYIKSDLQFITRTDLTKSKQEFEALWIEIIFKGQPNLVCGVLYRHPNENLESL